jgi:hypothetical protein
MSTLVIVGWLYSAIAVTAGGGLCRVYWYSNEQAVVISLYNYLLLSQ